MIDESNQQIHDMKLQTAMYHEHEQQQQPKGQPRNNRQKRQLFENRLGYGIVYEPLYFFAITGGRCKNGDDDDEEGEEG